MRKKFIVFVLGFTILPSLNFAQTGKAKKTDAGSWLIDSVFSLQEITVKAHFADANQTPLNLTAISPEKVRLNQTAPNFLEMFKGIAGVYATASTGSYGDATLNMRGFKQDNIAIMLNGIPIQGLVSGSMYWSNWMGLADATYSVQVQKGLGASMLADCAMGGMVNIVTKNASTQPRTELGVSHTQWGTTKTTISHSTGMLRGGWSVDMNVSWMEGSCYVDGTDVHALAYMLSANKVLDANNTLIFTAIGSPERRDQRNTELTQAEVDAHGRSYSKNWGWMDGKPYSIGHNHYAKPYFTLQHLMEGKRLSMKNSLYLAVADGGGSSTYNDYTSGVPSIIDHQTADGQIDFDKLKAENRTTGVAKNVMIDYLSGHTQAGGVVSAEAKLSRRLALNMGMQYQYYDTWSEMKIMNLLGGDCFIDPASKQTLSVGDYVGARYGRTTHHASGFVQGVFRDSRVTANLGVSVFNGNYRRHDFLTHRHSAWAHGWGASVKGGVVSIVSPRHSFYANAGYNSRLPYANVFLASSDLSITHDITNETNLLAELGWRHRWEGGSMELSGYVASWRNKTLTVSAAKRADAAAEKYQVNGLNALHAGVEWMLRQRLAPWLDVSCHAMTASWKWRSGGDAIIYDTYSGATMQRYSISCDGLHVGDAPQSQCGAAIDIHAKNGLYAHAAWEYNARMYADFEPSSRMEGDTADAYRLPAYHLVNAVVGWEGCVGRKLRMNLFVDGRNLFDAWYIERGTDGSTHDAASFTGYWGAARTLSAGIRLMM